MKLNKNSPLFQTHGVAKNVPPVKPEVGMGATYSVGSDRYPFTVVEIINDKTIVVQGDNYRRTDDNGLSESQEYEFTPNKDGPKRVLTFRSNGRWVEKKDKQNAPGYRLGHRSAYQDPCF
jgi:hypothetical protein